MVVSSYCSNCKTWHTNLTYIFLSLNWHLKKSVFFFRNLLIHYITGTSLLSVKILTQTDGMGNITTHLSRNFNILFDNVTYCKSICLCLVEWEQSHYTEYELKIGYRQNMAFMKFKIWPDTSCKNSKSHRLSDFMILHVFFLRAFTWFV